MYEVNETVLLVKLAAIPVLITVAVIVRSIASRADHDTRQTIDAKRASLGLAPLQTSPVQTAQASARLAPAGWYPDPQGISRVRYFDGRSWTDHRSN